jgi:class 3 adenylate cyclase
VIGQNCRHNFVVPDFRGARALRIESDHFWPFAMENSTPPMSSSQAQIWSEIRDSSTEPARLLNLWNLRFLPHSEDQATWNSAPAEVYETLAQRMLTAEAPLLALEVARNGLESFPNSRQLKQLKVLGLARTGDIELAQELILEVLRELRGAQYSDKNVLQEILGLMARLSKDRGLATSDSNARREILTQACNAYGDAYRITNGYWTGINEASLATLIGDPVRARSVAEKVREQCLAELKKLGPQDDPYWLLATLGETELNLRDFQRAENYYRDAGRIANKRIGDLNSTRKQARLLLKHFRLSETLVDEWLPIPKVVVFAGHMFDRPDRSIPRFPLRYAETVKTSIKDWLARNNVLVGFSSAANGADILFQEALFELGGETNVILPYEAKEFIRDSVTILGTNEDHDWERRAHGVINQAARVVRASSTQLYLDSDSYVFANQIMNGLAMIRARELDSQLLGLAVSDGQPNHARGGTASMIELWHGLKIPVSRVDLSILPADAQTPLTVVPNMPQGKRQAADVDAASPPSTTTVMALLFADAQGFSKLTDSEVPLFVSLFLGRIADLIQQQGDAIAVRETAGDCLFLAFHSVQAAGNFALQLSQLVNETDWTQDGFQHQLRLRTALHAGPVYYPCTDPITGLPKCCGAHVSQAARLEPATPENQVYASEAFAALAEMERATGFTCHYVKQLAWGKGYGTFPAYVVHKSIN